MGFFNNLSGLFGAAAFEVGDARFTHYIEAGSPRAASFVASRPVMRAELNGGVDDEIYIGVLVDKIRNRPKELNIDKLSKVMSLSFKQMQFALTMSILCIIFRSVRCSLLFIAAGNEI